VNKYTRQRIEQQRAAQDKKRLKRALSSVKMVGAPSPAREILALEKYHGDLLALRAEMVRKYGEARELWRIDVEMRRTLEQITRLRISQVEPERVYG